MAAHQNLLRASRRRHVVSWKSQIFWNSIAQKVQCMSNGWGAALTGTHGSLLDAGYLVRTLTERQGFQVGAPEEIAYRAGWIDNAALRARAELFRKNGYGDYLLALHG